MEKFLKGLNRFEEGLCGIILLGLACLTFVETFLRYTVSYSFPWFQEFANYALIFSTYLGASIGVKYGMHFSMEAVTEYTPDRVSHLLKTIAYFISGLAVILFIYFGIRHIQSIIKFGTKSPSMQIPMYIPYLAIPLFSITMSFRFFVLSYKHFKKFLHNEPYLKVRKKETH
ncbi:MAG TPA: TRAP transporter small permease [Syntrophorhabdaceae bacterium]|nr:TRAP transporter small permease [Syntrophorhabdaceae bacterium]